ncbi:MAG: hypothetical protein ACXADL_15870 [Candidatus Thorarchaeota archaeon]
MAKVMKVILLVFVTILVAFLIWSTSPGVTPVYNPAVNFFIAFLGINLIIGTIVLMKVGPWQE